MDKIKKEHILYAIQEIKANPFLRKGRASTTFDLIYEGADYPPKLVLSIANRFATGVELKPEEFHGGPNKPAFNTLEKYGFKIILKKDKITELISSYKKHIQKTQLKDEKYKWELVDEFKGKPNLDSSDLLKEIKSIKYGNLIYAMSQAVIYQLVKEKQEEIRLQFKKLFNDTVDLTERVKSFNNETLTIYRSIGETLQHHQDERTIATYLTFYNPEKYTFYKFSFYKKLCHLLNVKVAGKNEKYSHYLSLVNQIIEDYINEDSELIDLVKSYLPNYYDGSNHLLLVQDILFQMLDKNNNEDFELIEVLKKFNYSDLQNYYTYLDRIIQKFDLKENDKRLVFNFDNNQIKLTIGQKYAWNVRTAKSKDYTFSAISTNLFSKVFEKFDSLPLAYLNNEANYKIVENNSEGIFKAIETELSRTKKSSYYKHNEKALEKLAFDLDYRELIFSQLDATPNKNIEFQFQGNMNNNPLNQILYGPPGTGKTHTLQNKYFDKFTIKESTLSKEQYLENLVSDLNWWQVISIAVLDLQTSKVNTIHEHEIVKAKEKISDSKTVRPTIWGQLQRHTVLACEYVNVKDRSEPMCFSKDENSNWTIDSELLTQYYPEAFDILKGIQNFTGSEGVSIKNYEFITFHQSFSYEDFIEGIKPKLDENDSDLAFEIKDGVFKKLCLKAEADPENDYALFIDEINRGNVSAIFGELITLIESDKRLGKKNELKVKLPYSKKEFGVPKNLYIIGTMNTADRSVEALDTALRRRFSFVEMMPELEVVEKEAFKDFDRVSIMQKINQRVEVLLDRNYTLGHSYFIKEDFKNSFENEIMPLLQEYFYNDYGKIGLVLGKGFVREKAITAKNDKSIFADFDTKNEVDIIKSYELIPFKDIDFNTALKTLLA
ncbi:MAG: AAA family ATPase [Bacteroidota bacterium]